jgi:hypothetical protein
MVDVHQPESSLNVVGASSIARGDGSGYRTLQAWLLALISSLFSASDAPEAIERDSSCRTEFGCPPSTELDWAELAQ